MLPYRVENSYLVLLYADFESDLSVSISKWWIQDGHKINSDLQHNLNLWFRNQTTQKWLETDFSYD